MTPLQTPVETPVAVVTGAGSGIGLATVVELARRSHHVIALVRNNLSAQALMASGHLDGLDVEIAVADVQNDAEVVSALGTAIARHGRVDLLVNSAGVAATGVLEDTSPDKYASVFDVNVCGTVRSIQAVLPTMRAQGSGCIVNISSAAGRVAVLAQSAYVTSKWALEGMTEALAQELAPFGIRVALVEPGVTRSPIFGKQSGQGELPARGGPYDAHYRRMLRYYKRAQANASPAQEVAETVWRAAYGTESRLRHVCCWAGPELVDGRARMLDEDWVSLTVAEDGDYYDAFEERFGISLH